MTKPRRLVGLDVSVDIRVPEQGLVTVTPEESVLSQVLVVVLNLPFLVSKVLQVFSVFSMLQFNVTYWDRSDENSWDSNEVSDSLPQLGDTLRVVDFFFVVLDKGFSSGLVDFGWGIGSFAYELGNAVAVAVRVESLESELWGSSEHSVMLALSMERRVNLRSEMYFPVDM